MGPGGGSRVQSGCLASAGLVGTRRQEPSPWAGAGVPTKCPKNTAGADSLLGRLSRGQFSGHRRLVWPLSRTPEAEHSLQGEAVAAPCGGPRGREQTRMPLAPEAIGTRRLPGRLWPQHSNGQLRASRWPLSGPPHACCHSARGWDVPAAA